MTLALHGVLFRDLDLRQFVQMVTGDRSMVLLLYYYY